MKRSLGVCTWTYGPQDLKSIAGSLAYLGFDGVELMAIWRPFVRRKPRGCWLIMGSPFCR